LAIRTLLARFGALRPRGLTLGRGPLGTLLTGLRTFLSRLWTLGSRGWALLTWLRALLTGLGTFLAGLRTLGPRRRALLTRLGSLLAGFRALLPRLGALLARLGTLASARGAASTFAATAWAVAARAFSRPALRQQDRTGHPGSLARRRGSRQDEARQDRTGQEEKADAPHRRSLTWLMRPSEQNAGEMVPVFPSCVSKRPVRDCPDAPPSRTGSGR
jgi:hypothetical protein